jgi:hypothetical protein
LATLREYYNTQIEELPLDLSKIYDWMERINNNWSVDILF